MLGDVRREGMMGDETVEPAADTSGSNADPAAMAIALGATGALEPRATAYLEKQGALADLLIARMVAQDSHLKEEQRLQLSHLRIRRFSDYSKMALEIAVGLFLLAIVCGFGVMVWNAAHDHSLIIESFDVPPDMATRGVTGHAVAVELLDKLTAMEASTLPTAQTESSYRVDSGDAIKVEIPETGGLSLGEIDRYLRDTFGHETHVTGEIVHTAAGLALTVRAGGTTGARIEGADANLDALMQKAAEALFAQSEPLRYGDYLADKKRFDEAVAMLRPLALQGPPFDRARALTSWAEALDFDGRAREASPIIEEAVRLAPDASFAWAVVSDIHVELGHDEAAHHAEVRMIETAEQTWSSAELASPQLASLPSYIASRRDGHEGDFAAAAKDWNRMKARGGIGPADVSASGYVFEFAPQLAVGHDIAAARDQIAQAGEVEKHPEHDVPFANAIIAFVLGDWQAVIRNGAPLDVPMADDPYDSSWQAVQLKPLRAIAMARLGDFAGADALIAKTPPDCDLCARARGTIAALRHDWSTAEHWYALVAARSPSIPFADTDWGQMLLGKGDYAGAIAKFAEAHRIGPHFADPLEMWGEALMLQNRSDLALAKFEVTDNYAPNWGRLHLKWGEALVYSGKKGEAQKQFAITAALDLSQSDKAALARAGR
jgi:tetratricopeptide (TPR) repeat protein